MPARSVHLLSADATTLLTAEQVMEMLGVSQTALWILIRDRGLPYIKLGEGRRGALRFSSESVSRWLDAHEKHNSLSA